MKIYNLYERDIEVYVALREQRFSNETKNKKEELPSSKCSFIDSNLTKNSLVMVFKSS